MSGYLTQERLDELAQTALVEAMLELSDLREGIERALQVTLPTQPSPLGQVSSDLNVLNHLPTAAPMEGWLRSALAKLDAQAHQNVFKGALDELGRRERALPALPEPPNEWMKQEYVKCDRHTQWAFIEDVMKRTGSFVLCVQGRKGEAHDKLTLRVTNECPFPSSIVSWEGALPTHQDFDEALRRAIEPHSPAVRRSKPSALDLKSALQQLDTSVRVVFLCSIVDLSAWPIEALSDFWDRYAVDLRSAVESIPDVHSRPGPVFVQPVCWNPDADEADRARRLEKPTQLEEALTGPKFRFHLVPELERISESDVLTFLKPRLRSLDESRRLAAEAAKRPTSREVLDYLLSVKRPEP